MNKKIIEMVLSALNGAPTVAKAKVADEVENALEKQIPKKPIVKPYFDAVCCPICMETIDSVSIGNHRDKYCHYCGQKIDWGENE